MATMEQMKVEALERMKMLELHENAIREFKEEGKLNMSAAGGFLYWLTDEQQKAVDTFEEEHGVLVYHVVQSNFFGDVQLCYLYVSGEEEDWEYDRADLEIGCPLAYVDNLMYKAGSEFGSIGIERCIGGLRRTA